MPITNRQKPHCGQNVQHCPSYRVRGLIQSFLSRFLTVRLTSKPSRVSCLQVPFEL
jgi:hypothetical protein